MIHAPQEYKISERRYIEGGKIFHHIKIGSWKRNKEGPSLIKKRQPLVVLAVVAKSPHLKGRADRDPTLPI